MGDWRDENGKLRGEKKPGAAACKIYKTARVSLFFAVLPPKSG
jgi:hypothetical protein